MTNDDLLATMTDLQALSLTTWGESRGEPVEGQIAVMSVIRNRSKQFRLPYPNVVLRAFQFSCWNDNDPNRSQLLDMFNDETRVVGWALWHQLKYLAQGIIDDKLLDNTQGATHYYALGIPPPKWTSSGTRTRIIANHVFYKLVA